MATDAIREAMAVVRKHCELPANQRLFAYNEAAWTLARYLVEHAGELVRVKTCCECLGDGCHLCDGSGRIYESLNAKGDA